METANENSEINYRNELHFIKEEVASLRNDISRFLQRANQQHIEGIIGEMRKDFMRPMVDYLCEDASERMRTRMTADCEMRDFCETAFLELLQETAGLVGKGRVETETIKMYRNRLEELKKETKNLSCSRCFLEATNLFEKQVKLMRSLQIYEDREEEGNKIDISEIEPERLVSEICEPVANRQRLLMLKALSGESKTFSELSKLTGLRGGNLLFHLQKLLETGMILQRSERGDYIITRKGYSTLQGLFRIYSEIEKE
ncbi:transcriptional regulator, ArsR family [Methanosarcina thermophila]|jgi:DNA-binding transcriptional ArsR family regulator|uniref:Transcriptional regulator, ArsR family n=3 Tax=Methanosarcina thermophila TaxID=2210 RepID=A0A1I7AIS9_METTE|nr:winged helix-turn-helix domain-containing protein [Methanosarcina thermophila]ALK06000.1 MAG: ArsR family transcriptional regulator [Methanosarcina sp. 795]AKB12421.1 Transcriptional regulator, ArsR family [Methanosarcina thermophila TM-1]AKB14375.1 Transcriptional regulator, ArsR family [Methanosarcina thermophila CHTI-55]NLU57928.1 ArsR family transcriptional regulator [Methanosarcina thermophila]SFT74847.1 transcriptional regulator, ArsR family [Methanosarcina thermophila]